MNIDWIFIDGSDSTNDGMLTRIIQEQSVGSGQKRSISEVPQRSSNAFEVLL